MRAQYTQFTIHTYYSILQGCLVCVACVCVLADNILYYLSSVRKVSEKITYFSVGLEKWIIYRYWIRRLLLYYYKDSRFPFLRNSPTPCSCISGAEHNIMSTVDCCRRYIIYNINKSRIYAAGDATVDPPPPTRHNRKSAVGGLSVSRHEFFFQIFTLYIFIGFINVLYIILC